jgi:sporulation protein YlmC with PRC-barrel domain
MKSSKLFAILFSSLITMNGAWAETKSDPVVGGAIIAVNVDVVATTGYRASKLLGSDIYNEQGDNIGTLDDFIVGSDASVSIAVVAVGGFLGVGARMVAVPASMLTGNEKGQTVLPNATKEQLEALPEFRYAK